MHVPDEPLRVDLEIAPATDPIEGVLHAPDVDPRPFTGWLALMARIDEVRDARPRDEDRPRRSPVQGR
jgi:hypothetical protein